MTGIFKTKNPANVFLLVVLGILIKLPIFNRAVFELPKADDGILYQSLIEILKPTANSFSKLYPLLTLILLLMQGLMLNRFVNSQRLMGKLTYLPGMAYLLLTTLLPDWNYFSAPLIVNTIFLFIIFSLFKIYNNEKAGGIIFNAAFAAGVATFIYFPSIVFAVWILLAIMIMRPFKINEWVLSLLGVTTPYYFYSVYLFITDQWSWHTLFPPIDVQLPSVQQSLWLAGAVFLIVVPFLVGAWYVQNNLRRMLIQVRKGWSLILLYLLISLFLPLVGENQSFEGWIIAAVPFAAFHACAYLYSSYKIVPVILFWVSLIFVLAWQYFGHSWV